MDRSGLARWCCLLLLLTRLAAGDAPRDLVVVDWNVLGDAEERTQRLPALLAALREAKPDIITVQEATTWFCTALAAEPWAADLRRVEVDSDQPFPGGLAVFTRLPVTRSSVVELPTTMGRCGLCVEVMLGRTPLCFGVVHLDSLLTDGPTRVAQVRTMARMLKPYADSILLGDFNCADGDPEEREVLPGTVDVWRLLHPDLTGFTWDIQRSPMAKRNSFADEPSRRLDRVLLRSAAWQPIAMTLLGTEAVPGTDGRVFPSDHFGVRVVLRTP
jgi:poly(A) polymerase